jgi:hypothetical protein
MRIRLTSLVFLGVLCGCSINHTMRSLQKDWSDLLVSETSEQEASTVEKISSDIKSLEGFFDIYLTDSLRNRLHYSKFDWKNQFISVDLEVTAHGDKVVLTGWKPKKNDNLFLLVRE